MQKFTLMENNKKKHYLLNDPNKILSNWFP